MKAIPSLIGGVIGGGIIKKLFKKNKKEDPKVARPAQRDDVAKRIAQESILRQRRGGAADLMTGAAGAEAAPPGIVSLLGN